ncbi:MAG: hypothetical protein OEW18_04730 [Candidatus Aminicenantes bacterium]|nr:hypothetical protein [Candidatus Aminicenantes bacterium]
MRKAILVLSLAFLFLMGSRRGQQDTEQTRLGQITLTVRSVLKASITREGKHDEQGVVREENRASDNITYTFSGTQKMDVRQVEENELLYDVSPGMQDVSLTITGGGQESGEKMADELVYRIKGSWVYQAPPLPQDLKDVNFFHLQEAALGGPYEVGILNPLSIYPVVTSSGTVQGQFGTSPYRQLGWVNQSAAAEVMNRALEDPDFTAQFKGVLAKEKNGYQLSRRAVYSGGGVVKDVSRPWLPASWSGRWEVEYTLAFSPETELEAVIVPPENYESWLPTGDKDEDTPSLAPLVVRAELRLKDKPEKEPSERAKFKFELLETSKEPGLCLNAPQKDKAKKSSDLKIRQKENPELKIEDDGQSATSKEFGSADVVVIGSYDWGAYAKLKVTAILENEQELTAHLEGESEKQEMVIPLDENDNRVADGWEKEKNVYGQNLPADWDGAEEPQGQKAPGDGISLYEKYRGFEFEGIHERLDPNYKYVFVHDPDEIVRRINSDSPQTVVTVGEIAITNEVVRDTRFSAVSKLRLRYVDDDHWTGSGSSNEKKRIVNFNTGWEEGHAVDQHALDVVIDQSGGKAFPAGYQEARQRAGKVWFQDVPVEQGFAYPDIDYRFGSPTHTYRILILLGVIFSDIIEEAIFELEGVLWSRDGVRPGDDPAVKAKILEHLKARPRELGERLVKQEALVLSHEMAHGVGVQHHDGDSGKEECVITLVKPKAEGGAGDPFRLKTYKPWPHELCRSACWSQIIVSDLADEKGGK